MSANGPLPSTDRLDDPTPRPPRGVAVLTILTLAFLGGVVLFAALGIWQVERMGWKRDLIERVDARIHAPPAALPDSAALLATPAPELEYRRVKLTGRLVPGKEIRVQAVTEAGPGRWLMRPLQTGDGQLVMLNLGFVPDGWTGSIPELGTPLTFTGLLRVSEPEHGFLRRNDPGQQRWYSRNIPMIGQSLGLPELAPFFVDIDAASANQLAAPWPRGGMTVVRFRDHHLGYALTWFALALLVAGGAWRFALEEVRIRRRWQQYRTELDNARDRNRGTG